MTWSPSSPVTGGTMSQFTSPTYTLTADVAPDVNGKQHAVTTLGGTQTNVRSHTVSDPFTVTFWKPKVMAALQSPNPVTGKYGPIAKNTYGFTLRKGVNFAANQAPALMLGSANWQIPAGSDSYDSANIRAAISLWAGLFAQQSQGLADTLVTGIP